MILWQLIKSEPVSAMWAVQTIIALACAFGLNLTPVQIAALLTATGAVLSLLTRQNVMPLAKAPGQ